MATVVTFRLDDWPGAKGPDAAWDVPDALRAVPGYVYDATVRRQIAPAVKAIPELVPRRFYEQRALARAGRIAEDLLRIAAISDFVYGGRVDRRYIYGFHTTAHLDQLREGWARAGVDVRPWRSFPR